MRCRTSLLVFTFAVLLSGVEATAVAQSVVFKIETWKVNDSLERTSRFPGVELDTITPVGRGASSDLDCEGKSDDSGELNCVVKQCKEDDILANTYRISFKPPGSFVDIGNIDVRVSHCTVTPSPVVASLMERTLVTKVLERDVAFVFGKPSELPPAALLVSAETYGTRVVEVMGQPFGEFRARNLRRFVQDASLEALENHDNTTAVGYRQLAIAHANALVTYAGSQFNPQGTLFVVNGEFPGLYTNIVVARQLLAVAAEQDSTQADVLFDYSSRLSSLSVAANNGRLANIEFNQLEAVAAAVPATSCLLGC